MRQYLLDQWNEFAIAWNGYHTVAQTGYTLLGTALLTGAAVIGISESNWFVPLMATLGVGAGAKAIQGEAGTVRDRERILAGRNASQEQAFISEASPVCPSSCPAAQQIAAASRPD